MKLTYVERFVLVQNNCTGSKYLVLVWKICTGSKILHWFRKFGTKLNWTTTHTLYLIHDVLIFLGQMFSLPRHLIYLGLETENISVLGTDKHTFKSNSYKEIENDRGRHFKAENYQAPILLLNSRYLWSTWWNVFVTLKKTNHRN